MNRSKLKYVFFLLAGLLGQFFSGLFSIPWGSGLFTLIWIYAFLELVCRFHTKKELIVTGVVFTLAFSLKFAGALGSIWLDLCLFGVFGLALYAAFCISAHFMRRWDGFAGTLIFPAVWMLEYLLATVLRFPALIRVDMMFTDLNVLMHAERLIGAFGFSFAVIWMVSLFRFAVSHRKIWCAFLSVCLLFALFLPGIIYLYPNTTVSDSVCLAYTTGPFGGDSFNYVSPSYETNAESLTRSIREAASQKAEMLVFNEEAFELDDSDEECFIHQCASLAAENSIAVLLGLDVRDTDGSENGKSLNKIVMIGNDGKLLNSYQKSRLIPFLESSYAPGRGVIPSDCMELNGKSIKFSYLICYDSNFPGYVKRVEPDTDILLLPSWDWGAVTQLHARLCQAIAVENDIYILKPTYDGISVAVAPDGRIIHKSSTYETGYEQIHLVNMPIKSATIPAGEGSGQSAFIYAIIGTDIFSMLISIVLLACVLTIKADNPQKTRRTHVFSIMLLTSVIACGSDAFSWLLDGHVRLNAAVYFSSFVAMLATILLIWEFIIYLFEYIKEKEKVSSAWIRGANCFGCIASIITVIMTLNGTLFTVRDAVYYDGPGYGVYVLLNIGFLVFAIIAVSSFRRSLSVTDRIAAYAYELIPMASAIMNLFFEEWSFAYPATTLTLLLIYVMIQSDELDRLEYEGKIVSYHVTHDVLTGLHNRLAFKDRRAGLTESDGICGVIFSDLNGLKYANDHFGHAAGDELLIRFAGVLTGIFHRNDVFRISGDEFVCIMADVDEEVFHQRLHELKEASTPDGQPFASVGGVFGCCRDIDELIRKAEYEMYTEKFKFHDRFPKMKR